MYEIPANSKILNAPNNAVHGQIVLGPSPATTTDPGAGGYSGNFTVPDGVWVLWITAIGSGSTDTGGKGVLKIPIFVTPGEVIPWFIERNNNGVGGLNPSTFGLGTRQISSNSGPIVPAAVGFAGLRFGDATFSGLIIVEW